MDDYDDDDDVSFSLRIAPLHFQAGCRRKRLNLGCNLSRFILFCCIFVFVDLYLLILVAIYLVLC